MLAADLYFVQTMKGKSMIPEGDYFAIAISPLYSGDSNKKSTPFVSTTFKIDQDGDQKGAMIDWYGWLTDATRDRVVTTLTLCGFDGTDPASVMKNKVRIVVKHEPVPDTNPPRLEARVAWVNDPNRGGGAGVPHDAVKQAEVFSGLRGLIFAKREEMSKKAAASGDSAGFPFGANGQPIATPPHAPPPQAAKAPPKF
jgi:hypothetical protein